jgi:hypothetical protein
MTLHVPRRQGPSAFGGKGNGRRPRSSGPTPATGSGSSSTTCRHIPDGFEVRGEGARILIIFCPVRGREEYFQTLELMAAEGRETDQDELLELMLRSDQYQVERQAPRS